MLQAIVNSPWTGGYAHRAGINDGMDIRHTITRFGVTTLIGYGLAVTAIPATFAQNGEESVTYVYSDKATFHNSEVWYKGETLKINGEGFLTQDGTSRSTIAIKLNKGTVKIDGKDYLEVRADEKGNFSVSIPWQNDLDERISVDVYLLSGSLKDNNTACGGKAATVKIEARSAQEATSSATASASASATSAVVAAPSTSVTASATSATPSASVTASAESTRFANCAEAAAAGLAPMPSSYPDFRKKFDNDGNGLGCEVINSEVTDGSFFNSSSGSSSRNSGGLDNLGDGSSSSSSYTSSRAQRSSLANTGASNAFTIAGMGLVALGLGVAGVSAVRTGKNS